MEPSSITNVIEKGHNSLPSNVKEDQFMYRNQQIMTGLNKKIDRRLDIGYYCFGPKNRNMIQPAKRYTSSKKAQHKKVHPIKKKLRPKSIDRPEMVDQEQNTSEIFILRQPDPLAKDCSIQWVYEEPMEDKSIQQQISQEDQLIQYTLESQIIECRDASIQYSLEEEHTPIEIEEPIPMITREQKGTQLEGTTCSDTAVQLDQPHFASEGIQFDQQKPERKEKQLQIDIPDEPQLNKIKEMELKIVSLSLDQKKQEKEAKKAKKHIQIMKLRQQMLKLEHQIDNIQHRQNVVQFKNQKQIQLLKKQEMYCRTSQQIQELVSKIRKDSERPRNSNNYIEEEKKRQQEEKRIYESQKQDLNSYRKDVQKLTKQLKSQMFKRLKYQNESEHNTGEENNLHRRNGSSLIVKNNLSVYKEVSSLSQLFPPMKKQHVGVIIRNIPNNLSRSKNSQRKVNCCAKSMRSTKINWNQRSSFDHLFDQNPEKIIHRKEPYIYKIQKKLNESKQPDLQTFPKRDRKKGLQILQTQRYTQEQRPEVSYSKLLDLKYKIDQFFSNTISFKYLYGQTNKIAAADELFSIFDIRLVDKNSIQIFRYKKYFVFSYSQKKQTHFIVVYNDRKSIFYSKFNNQLHDSKYLQRFYSCSNSFKNNWAYLYTNSEEIYMGPYKEGRKQGYGILATNNTYYEGEYRNNLKQGKGIMILQNGDTYQGEFSHNLFHGQGTYLWSNGQRYSGFFRQGLKEGYGKQRIFNGDIYQGFYQNNKKNGKGKYIWSDGSIYEGWFVNDYQCGEGCLTSPKGKLTIGIWQKGCLAKSWNYGDSLEIERSELPLVQRKRLNFI